MDNPPPNLSRPFTATPKIPLLRGHSSQSVTDAYNTDLRGVLDKHAPEKEKVVVLRPHAPWYTEQAKQAKRERRKAKAKRGTIITR